MAKRGLNSPTNDCEMVALLLTVSPVLDGLRRITSSVGDLWFQKTRRLTMCKVENDVGIPKITG